MGKLSLILILITCVAAMPLAAQSTPRFQPAEQSEFEKLRKAEAKELREVRGGKSAAGETLRKSEIQRLEALINEDPFGAQLLRDMKAAGHYSWWGRWGWWVIGGSCGTTALILLIILIIVLLA